MAADPIALRRVVGDERTTVLLSSLRAIQLYILREAAFAGPVLGTAQAVVDYIRADIGNARVETVKLLLLDARRHLLHELCVSIGSIDAAELPLREILRHALNADARGIILVHNHPSGSPTPSRADIELTARIAHALNGLHIILFDHLIVTEDGVSSFRELGLI